jgi:hypothetical protein
MQHLGTPRPHPTTTQRSGRNLHPEQQQSAAQLSPLTHTHFSLHILENGHFKKLKSTNFQIGIYAYFDRGSNWILIFPRFFLTILSMFLYRYQYETFFVVIVTI